jgi:hypothetical protein
MRRYTQYNRVDKEQGSPAYKARVELCFQAYKRYAESETLENKIDLLEIKRSLGWAIDLSRPTI